jgi:hypothetical protein
MKIFNWIKTIILSCLYRGDKVMLRIEHTSEYILYILSLTRGDRNYLRLDRDMSCAMARVVLNDTVIYEANLWEYRPDFHSIDEFEFRSPEKFVTELKSYLEKLNYTIFAEYYGKYSFYNFQS